MAVLALRFFQTFAPGVDIPKNEKEVYTLRYSDFIMPMVKSIQELKAENDLLKKELEELKNLILLKNNN